LYVVSLASRLQQANKFDFFRTVFLDGDWFTLETASTLIANHSGLLHPRTRAPAEASEPTEAAEQQQQQQQRGRQRQAKLPKQRESPPPPPPVPLTPLETAAAALSGIPLSLSLVMACPSVL